MKAYGYKHDDRIDKKIERQRAQREINEEVNNIIHDWVDSYYYICEWEDYTDEPRPYLRAKDAGWYWKYSSCKFVHHWVAA